MSSSLYRLGRAVARRRRLVLVAWLLLLAVLGAGVPLVGGTLNDNFSIPGTESQDGLDVLATRFPQVSGASGQLLFTVPEGERIADRADDVEAVLADAREVTDVVAVTDPFAAGAERYLAADGRHALAQVQLSVPLGAIDDATRDGLVALAADDPAGLRIDLGGQVLQTTGVHVSATEAAGVVVAGAVLALTFGSAVAAGVPVLTALLGVGVALAGIVLAAGLTDISSTTPTLALMIGLAVGIDYALFVLSRHRAQLAGGMAVEESLARATATAGSAVIFAGTTVVIALCGLAVAGIPFLTVMGVAAAAAVAVAVAVALTALPAVLAMLGERLRPRPGSRAAARELATAGQGRSLGRRWVALVTRVPALTVVVVVAGLLVMAVPAKDLRLALPDNGARDPGDPARVTYDLIADAYGPGFNAPLVLTADLIRTTDPVAVMRHVADDVAGLDDVASVPLATPNPTGDLGVVQIVPREGQTAASTADLVRALRDLAPRLEDRYDLTDVRVTGHTAVTIDISDRLGAALVPFGIVVVGLSLVLLTVVFRSIAVPIKATAGYLLSVLAAFGALSAVFEWGWFADALDVQRVGPVISFLPIILMGVLFGLAMDYEVFLVSRMREHYVHTGDAAEAITAGFAASARVVAAAAVIMFAVFAAFVPAGDPIVKPIAFGLAVGVFVDAFVVRMTLVPAVLALLGRHAWTLPDWLERRLPTLDVEGVGLERHLEHEAWQAAHGPAAVRAERVTVRDEAGAPLVAGADLAVRPGELVAVGAADPLVRQAFLAAVAGRLYPEDGTLVVLGRVLPDEAGAVRARAAFFPVFPSAADLARCAGPGRLVLVDGADADPARAARRWAALAELTESGTTVLAGRDPAVPWPAPAPRQVCLDRPTVPALEEAAL
ncbi:MMPL family transporter [Georgenia thermotolerans]|uniref:MMPL family transporter n=1 Tax=Georgenia thermotolerans TaxID=527326 RepID=A0A7J5UKQ5_9MICO|nr:MMPL family transporter [Georgenia thermotolerans]KAE8762870.1 MMPL family transporter [Georgenia thermotolerans]